MHESSTVVPQHAQVVVIGGGIIGCSTAYHLSTMGCQDVLLLEQYQLTAGSTWHAAGAIGQLRSNANITNLLGESVAIYEQLAASSDQPTGWVRNGSLRLALTPERVIEYEIAATVARSYDVEFHLISGREAGELIPQMNVSDVLCAAYLPSDGVANPSDITMAFARGARKSGVKIIEGVKVTDISVVDGHVKAVHTSAGRIECETVVNCAGIWSREVGNMAGVNVPIQPSHHQYIVTEPIDGLARHIPGVRDPDKLTYFKEEVGGLAAGGYEFNPVPYTVNPIPPDHEFKLMDAQIDQFAPILEGACARFPDLEHVGVKQWFNGIESFTEDGMFILGEAPEVRNFYVGTGFNSFGIASAGGTGKALAYWIIHKEPPFDLWAVDIRRFAPFHRSEQQVLTRSLDGQARHYKLHYPHEETEVCRGLRRSPVYAELKAAGACFGSKFGWERPNWFSQHPNPKDEYRFGRQNWFDDVAREHTTCRQHAALFDQSSFAKFLITGSNATDALQYLGAGNFDQPPGKIIYSPMLNQRGGIEADLTVTRLDSIRYMIVAGTASATRDFNHIVNNTPSGMEVQLVDISSAYGCLSLMGPAARSILSHVAESSLANDSFPLNTASRIIVAGAPAIALRVAFVGELGWELYVPTEYMVSVYRALKEAGAGSGMVDAGYRCIDSLRLEKARRVWGHEIGPDYTPIEAGLGFTVDFDKENFIGRDTLLAQKQIGVSRKLCTFSINDPEVVLYGKETVFRNGARVGWLTSGGFGHTVGQPIGLGFVSNDDGVNNNWLLAGEYELEVRTVRHPATIHLQALYDPTNERVKS